MKKKIIIIALVVAVVTAGVYFGVSSQRERVPVLEEGFGIWESELVIDDACPGATGLIPLTILCGKDYARTFTVSIEQPNPNKLKNGYEAFPVECYDWITLPDESIHIKAGSHHHLDIPFRVPYSASYEPGTHMEARARVTEVGQGGLVQLAIEAKWYIIITATAESP